MKRPFIIIAILVLFAGGVFFVTKEKPLYTPEIPQGVQTVEGKVTDLTASARIVTVATTDGRTLSLALDGHSQIYETSSAAATSSFAVIHRGFTVRATGEFSKADTMLPATVRIIVAPNVIVFTPEANDALGVPATITGEARVFENTVNAKILDGDGTVLGESFTTAKAADVGQYGNFEMKFSYRAPKNSTGTIEVYSISAKDGSEINKVIVPIRFAPTVTTDVKLYFPNASRNGMECEATYPTVRRIAATGAPARAALDELLRGPDSAEQKAGFSTAIPSGVVINSLTIQNGLAKVDFNAALEQGGGSCHMAALQSQIRETLMQFSTVQRVTISINGRTADILQP